MEIASFLNFLLVVFIFLCRFVRQRSEPGGGAVAEDPYAFPPSTPGMEGPPHPGIRMSVADAFSIPPGTPQPSRMPERQMSMPGKGIDNFFRLFFN